MTSSWSVFGAVLGTGIVDFVEFSVGIWGRKLAVLEIIDQLIDQFID